MNPITVAIVDDVEAMRKSLELLINGSQGFEVLGICATSVEALECIPNWKPDVVLMDIELHDKMNGIECVAYLKSKGVRSQFMMCTVYEDSEKIFEALKAGATGYLLKKAAPLEILEAIKSLYNGGSPMSAEIARKVVSFFNSGISKKSNIEGLDQLTPRENEILQSLSQGMMYKEIANSLFISLDTVKRHIQNIYEKLQVSNKTEAVNKYFNR